MHLVFPLPASALLLGPDAARSPAKDASNVEVALYVVPRCAPPRSSLFFPTHGKIVMVCRLYSSNTVPTEGLAPEEKQ